jgi:lactate dehydrogenase-like 2-hydroxyacid dehydrogenase
MKILIRHRDSGSQRLMQSLTPLLPGAELIDWPAGGASPNFDGIDAVVAIGEVGRDVMERGKFGLIQTMGTGYDHIDLEAATELGIYVAHLPAAQTGNAQSVAEHAILLMLALARRLKDAQENVRQGRWAQPMGRALLDKTVCIVGLGDLGLALAARLHAFEMRIQAMRRDPSKGAPAYVELVSNPNDADFVIICARPNAENVHMVNREWLAGMKKGAILINVARGSLVDEQALGEALGSGHLGGVGLDVFEEEPANVANPLLTTARVVATPHIAGVTDVNLARSFQLLAENLQRFGRGEEPRFLVNHPRRAKAQ